MHRFGVELSDKSEWVGMHDPENSSVFVASEKPCAVGEMVRLDLVVGKGGPKIIFRGKVISRQIKSDGDGPTGFSMALGPEESEKVNYLTGFVRGGMLDLRQKRRLPIRLNATYGGIAGPVATYTRDINEEGVFVVSEEPLPEQSEVHLLITFPDQDEAVSISGIVSHTVVVEDEDVPGMGIKFNMTSNLAVQMVKLIDEVEARFVSGSLPEEYLL